MGEALLAGRAVVVMGHRPSVVGAVVEALRAAGAEVTAIAPGPWEATSRALGRVERYEILVHVAPPSRGVGVMDGRDQEWADEVALRVTEPLWVARMAAARMRGSTGGCLVFVGTLDATHAYAGHADAAMAMGALGGLVRSLAVELAPDGIRANLVLAGPIEEAPDTARADLVERTLLRSPSGRFVLPEEVAAGVLFVAGPDAGFMTGQSLRVDAGWASLNQAPDGMRFP